MRIRRWIAGLLCICLLCTSDAFAVQAASLDTTSANSQKQELSTDELEKAEEVLQNKTSEEEQQGGTDNSEEKKSDPVDDMDSSDKKDSNVDSDKKSADSKQEESLTEEPQEFQEAPLINYAVIDQPYIETPGEQTVVVGIGDENTAIEKAVLEYKNRTTGEIFREEVKKILENAMMFQMNFPDKRSTGIYELSAVTYVTDGVEYRTEFATAGMEMVFGVNKEIDSNPDGVVIGEEEIDIDVVTIDENGNTTSQNNIEEAIDEVQAENGLNKFSKSYGAKNGNIVVMLDPGHDATHQGASGNGLKEEILNLKIAQFCKTELETYAGVTVDMTRDGEACPYSGTSSSDCNFRRVEYAKKMKADIYVSIHNNSGPSSANGAEVYYPNTSYNTAVSNAGKDAAQKILDQLEALGLEARGIKIRNSENGTLYPDGNIADYYGVIKNCKKAGIPAIIVEHAFLTSSTDAAFLNSDAKLKKLGIADATGIAKHFGLKKKNTLPPPAKPAKATITSARSTGNRTISLKWTQVKNASGYGIYRSTQKDGDYERIATVKSGSTLTYKDKGVEAEKIYYYKVKTRATGNGQHSYSGYSNVKSTKTIKNTSITSTKSVGDKNLEIKWKKKSGANGYYLYRSLSKDKDYQKIATIEKGDVVSYKDSGLTAGKTYYYKIKSRNKGDGASGYSNYSKVFTGKTVAKPSISYVKSTANKRLEVSWKEVSGANGYYLYRSTAEKGTYQRIATISGKSTTKYADKDIEIGKTYYYKMKARNKVNGITGYSSYSKVRYGKTVVDTDILSVTSKSSTKLRLNWKAVSGANGYYIYRSTSKDKGYKKITTVSGKNIVEYIDSSLKTGETYYYKIKTRNKVNGSTGYSSYSNILSGKTLAKTEITSLKYSKSGVKVSWKKVSGANGYNIRRSSAKNGSYSKIASVTSGDTVSYQDKTTEAGKTYYYQVEAMNTVKGKKGYSGYCSAKSVTTGTAIMGASEVSVKQMVAYYNRSGKKYPSSVYTSKGAGNITTFCNIVMQEAAAEGVRADVVFAQICHETGFLQFGGDVKAEQCNFAGLGATGNGVSGEVFPNVRTGIRAQVQHLKAYASKQPLNQACVDKRFSYVTRESAPYVEWLGIQENPYGKGWAASKNYGYNLMNIVKVMQTM
ncbi:MAG: hypothetical protein HFI37_07390 [Lachnospiraceae bacterium]|nr:hypothetical protein [Lachnospiraceae bacterium]